MKYTLLSLIIIVVLAGCSNQKKLEDAQANFNAVVATQQAQLDRELQDATIKGMLLNGEMSEHEAAVFEECREAESKTPTCQRLYRRVTKWETKIDAKEKAQLKTDGVTQ